MALTTMPSFCPLKADNVFIPFEFQLFVPLSIKLNEQYQFRNEGMGWHCNGTHEYRVRDSDMKYSGMRGSSNQHA